MKHHALLLACLFLWPSTATADKPWLGEPFSATPQQILDAAKTIEFAEDRTADTLFTSTNIKIDDDHKVTKTSYSVWRVKTEDAAREEALIQISRAPWYQNRTKIHARVIRPDGTVFQLDPKTISESKPPTYDSTILTSDLMIQAPLPGITAGCIVEQLVTQENSRPFFKSGSLEKASLIADHHLIVTVEAPSHIPLRYKSFGSDIQPKVEETDDKLTVSYNVTKPWTSDSLVPYLPSEQSPYPYIAVSTGASWAEVAKSYAEIAESRIDGEFVKPIVSKVLDGNESAKEAAGKLLIWMRTNSRVRYTGIEFGRSAIVPYHPKETLARGFGDCKDQSALLVSMMRAAGFDASIALLHTGYRRGVRHELPGLNAFNHAIVFVGGNDSFWVDPTDPYSPPGTLPLGDQGQLALIANDSTNDLTETPKSASTDNQTVSQTTVFLSPSGKHRLTEKSTYSGSFTSFWRQTFAESASELNQIWKDYGERTYGKDTKLRSFTHSDLNDLSPNGEHTTEFEDASTGSVGVDAIMVDVVCTVLDSFPPFLLAAEKESENGKPTGPYLRPRTQPLQLPERYVSEAQFTFHVPNGYAVGELPPSIKESFGPVILSLDVEQKNKTVVVRGRLDTGHGLLEPEQVTRLRARLAEITKNDIAGYLVQIRFNHQAYEAAQTGRLVEAVRLYQATLEDNPESSAHYRGFVSTLVRIGQVEAAKEIANKAVAAFPNDAKAWSTFASASFNESFGRALRGNFDFESAKAAFEKSLKLNPDDAMTRYNHAYLLEHNKRGDRYSGDLEAAKSEYEKVFDDPAHGENARLNHTIILFYQGKYDDLLKEEETIDQLLPQVSVAVAAMRGGVPAAKIKAAELSNSAHFRAELLIHAGSLIDNSQEYGLAADLYSEAAWSHTDSATLKQQAEMLRLMRRGTEEELFITDPKSAGIALFRTVVPHGLVEELLSPLLVKYNPESDDIHLLDSIYREPRRKGRQSDVPVARREDAVQIYDWNVEGSEDLGFRLTAKLKTSATSNLLPFHIPPKRYNDDKYKILLSGREGSELGRHALRLLEEDKLEDAVKWLRWAKDYVVPGAMFDAYSGSPFSRIWSMTDTKDADSVRLAATCLACFGSDSKEYVTFLMSAVKNESNKIRKTQLERSLMRALDDAEKYDDLAALAEQGLKKHRRTSELHRWRVEAYVGSGETEKAKNAADEWSKALPRDIISTVEIAKFRLHLGEHQRSYDMIHDLIERTPNGLNSRGLLNAFAWSALFLEQLPPGTLENAMKSCEGFQFQNSASLHTLACVLAERGQVQDSQRYLTQSIESRPGEKIEDHDWYVVARNLETLGLKDNAARVYRRIQKPTDIMQQSTYVLAQRRLALMKAKD